MSQPVQQSDCLYIAISKDRQIHGYICSIQDSVEQIQKNHNFSMISTAIFARALTAGILLSGNLKNQQDRLGIKWNCDGPVKGIFVDVGYNGNVRGTLDEPMLTPIEGTIDSGEIALEQYIGFGEIVVTRKTRDDRPAYYSISPISSGEIASDVSLYLRQSLQIDSALNIGLSIDSENRVEACGGLLLQAYPDAKKSSIKKMHDVFAEISSFTNLLRLQYDNNSILQDVLGKFDLEIIGSRPIQFYCSCSRDNIMSILNGLSQKEFVRFVKDDGTISAVCEYCSKEYLFNPEELKQFIQ